MSLELNQHELSQAEALWKTWESSTDVELESTFRAIDMTSWLNVVQHFRSLGLNEEVQVPKLNIMVAGGLRFTLVGEGVIQEFCKDNTLAGKPFHVVLKEKKGAQSAAGDTVTEIDWKNYGVRVKLRREIPLDADHPRVRDALARWATSPKSFRYIKRYSFSSVQHKGIQFDLSLVRHNRKGANGQYIQATSFLTAEIAKQPTTYEVEVEAIRTNGGTFKSFCVGVATVLRGIQKSFVLIRDNTKREILDMVNTLTGSDDNAFPGPQPATLERKNLLPATDNSTASLLDMDYNVTDKADGERCLLVVNKKGRIYLVDTNRNVYASDLKVPEQIAKDCIGTVLDGEWVKRDADDKPVSRYYAFDIYNGRGGADVSQLSFITRGASTEQSRIFALTEATGALSAATSFVPSIPKQYSLSIHMKTFETPLNRNEPNGIFKKAGEVLDRLKKDAPYHTDGLIFTPNDGPLPKNKRSWPQQLKWKPSEDNTIDFMVTIEKERDNENKPTSVDLVSNKLREDTNEIVRYKTLRLFVGSNTDTVLVDPRDTILNQRAIPEVFEDSYKPRVFTPIPMDPMGSVCYVPIDAALTAPIGLTAAQQILSADDTIRCTRSLDTITSRSVVEMAYHPEKPAGWRWEPIRIRWDKTEKLHKGRVSMNSDWVAQSIWDSIHNPVTELMIRTGSVYEADETGETPTDSMIKSYYHRKAPARDQYRIRGLRAFHNYIKEELLLSRAIKEGSAVYDMTCGEAGDMHKWHANKAGWVLGTDIAEKNLTDNATGAYHRYLMQIIRNKGKYTPMLFVQANAAMRLMDGGAGQSSMDRAILRCLWGSDEPDAPAYAQSFKNKASAGFDIVSCMFSLHYFFKDRATLDGWLRNISDTLKIGGYFVGCCFDGNSVAKFLQDIPQGEMKRGIDGDVDIWSITKKYGNNTLPATDEGLGRAIDVSFLSIGETFTEYLVSWDYLKERMSHIGLDLLNAEELAEIGLKNSTALFSDSHKMSSEHGRTFPMSAVIRQYSFLNRWFIFRRRSAASDMPYVPITPTVAETKPEMFKNIEVPEENSGFKHADMKEIRDEVENEKFIEELENKKIDEEESYNQMPNIPQMVIEENTNEVVPDEIVGEEEDESEDDEAEDMDMDKEEEEEAEAKEEDVHQPIQKATGPIYKFYHKSEMKDDLQLNNKAWRRYLSTYTLFSLKDMEDPTITYPSMEAAFTAAKYKYASNKPQLASLFGELGEIHQKYARTRLEKGTVTEKENYALMEEEGDEFRKAARPTEMKKLGAKFDEVAWRTKLPAIVDFYVKQRYTGDEIYKNIMLALEAMKAHIVFFTTPSTNEFSGRINEEEGEIEGENLLGKAMMKVVGLYY
jgi:hypothetical protein